jgi:DNA-binding MurR/RpiR family transcriptional regulator
MKRLVEQRSSLTRRARILADYVRENPRRVVFMRTRELASACQVSESTVIRFVDQLGFSGYGEFIQALRDFVDSELTLIERVELSGTGGAGRDRLGRLITEEIDNLKQLYETIDLAAIDEAAALIGEAPSVFVVGSRLSYTLAYYMGWSLAKIRSNIQIMRGSDSTAIDWLTIAPAESLVVIIATSRYPNELLKLARWVRRLKKTLLVITDSPLCPLLSFAHLKLIAPSRTIPVLGSPGTLSCLINYLNTEVMARHGEELKAHQEKLEQSYRENDILFNLEQR